MTGSFRGSGAFAAFLCLALLAFAAAAGSAFAGSQPAAPPSLPAPAVDGSDPAAEVPAVAAILAPQDIHPGQQGYAKTVFEGTEARAFPIELLGRVSGTQPKGDLILFRALGDSLAHTGIVAGMSGSPVYVDGKLVGAIAFAFPFAKDAVGMITPIGEMLEGLERIDEPPAPWMAAPAGGYEPFRRSFLAHSYDAQAWAALAPPPAGGEDRRSLITMVGSGWSPEVRSSIEGFARGFGAATPVVSGSADPVASAPTPAPGSSRAFAGRQEGGSGSAAAPPARAAAPAGRSSLQPGSAVGVLLIDGDASLAAVGTVTYRKGEEIVAFGHPLFQAGPVELPLTSADVQGIVSSYDSSFKMANAGPIIGTLRQDLRSGISGRLGPTPPMLPARITLDGPDGRREYRYRIARGVLLEPTLLGWAATNSFLHQGWRTGEAAMDGTLTIHYNGGRTLVRRDRLASRLPSSEIAGVLLAPVPLLLTNPFEPVTLDSVSLDVSYAPKLAESILVDLWAERAEVRPGETLSLTARLQDRQGTRREIPVEIQVPERWRGKSLLIVAGGARDLTEWDQDRSPSIYEPKDLAGLERLIREYPDAGDLLVRIYGEEDGVVLGDLEMGPLPGSIESVLGSAHKRGPARPSTNYRIEERRIDAASVVTGGLGVRVRVEP